jgi:hypothetical protein
MVHVARPKNSSLSSHFCPHSYPLVPILSLVSFLSSFDLSFLDLPSLSDKGVSKSRQLSCMAIGGARVDCHKVLLNPGFFEESFVTLNMFASFQRLF